MTPQQTIELLQVLITCLAPPCYRQQRTEAVDMLNTLSADRCNERLLRMAGNIIEQYENGAEASFLFEREV